MSMHVYELMQTHESARSACTNTHTQACKPKHTHELGHACMHTQTHELGYAC